MTSLEVCEKIKVWKYHRKRGKMFLNPEQEEKFLKGELSPTEVVEIVGNDGSAWRELLQNVAVKLSNFQRYEDALLAHNRKLRALETWFNDVLESGGTADESEIEDLGSIFGFEMVREMDAEVVVRYQTKIYVPLGKTVYDANEFINADISIDDSSDFVIEVFGSPDIEIEN